MIIRPADIDDARQIATIHVRSWQHAYADILPAEGLAQLNVEQRTQAWAGWLQAETNPLHILVADENGEVLGFASWGASQDPDAEPNSAMLYSIYLRPDAMHHGIGSQLLESTEVDMIASGATSVTLEVLVENETTRAFYERNGWQPVPDSESDETFFGMNMRIMRYYKDLQ